MNTCTADHEIITQHMAKYCTCTMVSHSIIFLDEPINVVTKLVATFCSWYTLEILYILGMGFCCKNCEVNDVANYAQLFVFVL